MLISLLGTPSFRPTGSGQVQSRGAIKLCSNFGEPSPRYASTSNPPTPGTGAQQVPLTPSPLPRICTFFFYLPFCPHNTRIMVSPDSPLPFF